MQRYRNTLYCCNVFVCRDCNLRSIKNTTAPEKIVKTDATDRATPHRYGFLYIVATPIGNLEDMTLRAMRVLKEVDLIACEDTRHSRKLLNHFQINTPLISYYREKEVSRGKQIIKELCRGKNVALVSDAGMPCISDPGYRLAAAAHDEGIRVITVPGASALVSAVAISGLNSESFFFHGFLPSKKNERRKMLQSMASQQSLLIFYESPHRLMASLKECLDVLGDRFAAVCKELTKIHERCFRGRLSHIIAELSLVNIKGEYVLVIEGSSSANLPPETDDLQGLLLWYRDESGRTLKDSVHAIASDLGLSRSMVYSEALKIWKKD